MKPNKTPGHDGIPKEFYKSFGHILKKILMDPYKYWFKYKERAYSHCKAINTLIFKNNDRSLLKNYRPISLSNVINCLCLSEPTTLNFG